jgi:hypothetical protein
MAEREERRELQRPPEVFNRAVVGRMIVLKLHNASLAYPGSRVFHRDEPWADG